MTQATCVYSRVKRNVNEGKRPSAMGVVFSIMTQATCVYSALGVVFL